MESQKNDEPMQKDIGKVDEVPPQDEDSFHEVMNPEPDYQMNHLKQTDIDDNRDLQTWNQMVGSNAHEEGEAEMSQSIAYQQTNQTIDPLFMSLMNRMPAQSNGLEFSEVQLKKQFFRAARTNKVEVFHQTLDKMNNDLAMAWQILQKRDPEGRSTIVLCLLFASFDVLKEIFETFCSKYDMRQHILRQEFDNNTPALNMAMSLMPFEQYRDRSIKTTQFLLDLVKETYTEKNQNSQLNYHRFMFYPDRLGRTSLHVACMHGLPLDDIEFMVNAQPTAVSEEDIEGLTPVHYAIDNDNDSIV